MSIRVKLTIIFLAFVSLPLMFVSLITFTNYEHSLETDRLAQMEYLAGFKAERIEAYFSGLKTNIEMAQNFYNIRKNLPVLIRHDANPGHPEALAAKKMLDAQLSGTRQVLGLTDIMLADREGRIVYVCNPHYKTKDFLKLLGKISPALLKESATGLYFSDVFFSSQSGAKPQMLAVAPAFDMDNTQNGSIIFETDMTALYRIVQDTTGLGATGEILIGKKQGREIVYLNPLRHDPATVLSRRVQIGDSLGLPIQKAVLGETGVGQSVDYRGEKVIAAWRPVPALGWGLAAKIDSSEAFANVINLRRLVIMILGIVFILAAIIVFSVAESIARPIKMLSRGAEIIGGGNLDHRVGTDMKDEIGRLSRAFDKMTHDLKATTASRDELNREVAERKRTEEALRESEERLSRAQEIAHLGSWELDLTNDRLTWSDEVYRIFGFKPREFGATYETFLEAVHPDDRAAVDEAYSASLREGRDTYEIEHRVVRKTSGEIRFVHEKCRHFRGGSGEIARSIGMVHDITERKRAEEALRHTADELARSNKDLEQFAYVASHDLQEPLRAVAGFVNLLERRLEGKLDDKQKEYMRFIMEGAVRMQALINGLLEYARIETRARAPEIVDVNAILEQVRLNLQKGIEESGVVITAGTLPMVQADPIQLSQLFQNLIGNAIKFRNKVNPEIRIRADRQSGAWRFSVSDNGIGIDTQYQERIFLIFQRLHTRKEYAGTGIGLAICKKIVERHGGRIWVESIPEQGSTFYFTIPDKGEFQA